MAWILSDQFAVNSMRGGCANCANDRPRKLPHGVERIVALDFETEFSGTVEFCESCIEEAAKMLGMVPKRVLDKAKETAINTAVRLQEAKAEIDDAQATIRVLTAELNKAQVKAEA